MQLPFSQDDDDPWKVGDFLLCSKPEFVYRYASQLLMRENGTVTPEVSKYQPRIDDSRPPKEAVVTGKALGIDGIHSCVRIHFSGTTSACDEWIYAHSSRLAQWPADRLKPLDLYTPLDQLINADWPELHSYIGQVQEEMEAERARVLEYLDTVSRLPKPLLILIVFLANPST